MNAHDAFIASARIYRAIADPVIDGADPWLIGSTFESEYRRDHVQAIIDALLVEGMIEQRDGHLYPMPYDDPED